MDGSARAMVTGTSWLETSRVAEPGRIWNLRERTQLFALGCLEKTSAIPRSAIGKIFVDQVVRAATSVGANYRAAALARSRVSFIAKLSIALEEVDEVAYWLELMAKSESVPPEDIKDQLQEAEERTSIFIASRKKARAIDQANEPMPLSHSLALNH